ncbi:hypothetical protein PFC_02595 [Pyrococcus furiosus COM1]|uniref:Uncharacterized protein n=1 Tax=Pyrococcus furiosus COM1 TaxID=1185654 RepID=I6UNV6_9EURY|nr:hypothetical protein PFC_02595 [Pyrococcus furiosus COM1]
MGDRVKEELVSYNKTKIELKVNLSWDGLYTKTDSYNKTKIELKGDRAGFTLWQNLRVTIRLK